MTAPTSAGGLRGAARQAAIDRLAAIDAELLQRVRATLPPAAVSDLEREAGGDLQPFRAAMAADAYARAKEAAVDQLVRERFGLPTIVFP